MKNKHVAFNTLPSHPLPEILATSTPGRQIRQALTRLDTQLAANSSDRVLLLLEQELLEDLSTLLIERFLRYTSCQRVLLLVPQKLAVPLVNVWDLGVSWEDGRPRSAQYSATVSPQRADVTQVCMTTAFAIQVYTGMDVSHPFFDAFDALVLYEVPGNTSAAWNQIVELYAGRDIRVIGLSSTLSEEDGRLLFEQVIDAKGAQAS